MPVDHATNVNLLALVFVMAMGLFILFLPRRFAIVPVLVTACYITMGQVINIAGLNFTLIRVVILIGWLRVLCRGEAASFRMNGIDRALILWALTSAVVYNLASQTQAAFINQLGFLYNTLGIYFLFRCLVMDLNEAVLVVKALTIIILPMAAAMIVETLTQRNVFSVLGGVAEYSEIREGKLRAQGAFSHPILAGSFGATLIPLFAGLWRVDRNFRFYTAMGICAALVITLTSVSSGPLLTCLFGLAGLAAWCLRHRMRLVRWSILAGVVSLHMVMTAPVWYIFARLGKITGGTGWHRSELINQAILHIDEWWLAGTRYTAHWMPYSLDINPDMADITNEYLRVGVDGGLVSLLLFILLIVRSFSSVGNSLAAAEHEQAPVSKQIFLWCLGSAFFAHAVTFLSVSYFDQIILFWLLLIAVIASADSKPLPVTVRSLHRAPLPTAGRLRCARPARAALAGSLRLRD